MQPIATDVLTLDYQAWPVCVCLLVMTERDEVATEDDVTRLINQTLAQRLLVV